MSADDTAKTAAAKIRSTRERKASRVNMGAYPNTNIKRDQQKLLKEAKSTLAKKLVAFKGAVSRQTKADADIIKIKKQHTAARRQGANKKRRGGADNSNCLAA